VRFEPVPFAIRVERGGPRLERDVGRDRRQDHGPRRQPQTFLRGRGAAEQYATVGVAWGGLRRPTAAPAATASALTGTALPARGRTGLRTASALLLAIVTRVARQEQRREDQRGGGENNERS
jgi:hypothetical protein